MYYNKIRKMDIANGPGVRVSIFFQGCSFHCNGCFNPETWNFDIGKEFTDEVITHILELCKPNYISGLSILGGEPLHPKNISGCLKLVKSFKKTFPDKTIWLWTGFNFEDVKNKEVLKYIDVLIDGQFKKDLYNPSLKWKGSSNQRVIDIQKSFNSDIILYRD